LNQSRNCTELLLAYCMLNNSAYQRGTT